MPVAQGCGMTSMTMQLSAKSRDKLDAARKASAARLERVERECLKELSENLRTQWGRECRLATINANGIRDSAKRDALAAFLIDFCINVCVVSETHLREEDITNAKKYFLDYGYTVEAHCCRNTGQRKIGGGVIILVHIGLPSVPLKKVSLPDSPVDACSLCVCPTAKRTDHIRITGAYCPPPVYGSREGKEGEGAVIEEDQEAKIDNKTKFKPSKVIMDAIFRHKTGEKYGEEACGHLVVGDLNPTVWEEGYQEWLAESGAWELTDPLLKTHSKGGALDKIIFLKQSAEVVNFFAYF